MEYKRRFIECLVPSSLCNLKCEYCYVIQQNRREGIVEKPQYSVETMIKGLSKARLGGACFFSLCAIGETLIPDYLFELVKGLLKEGHYINITNNGTVTNRIKEYCDLPKNILSRLHFSFSFHYNELKKFNLIDTFFKNVQSVKNAGCSFIVKLNLCDSYINQIEEIKEICLKNIGAYPVISITRDQAISNFKLFTNDQKRYLQIGKSLDSKMFDFTNRFFNKKIKRFCYAGDWSALLNLKTGVMSKCYANTEDGQDIFADISKPINFQAIGRHCKAGFCVNADHFITQGVIPSLKCDGYADIRTDANRQWYNQDFYIFANQKLNVSNKKYNLIKKTKLNLYYFKLFLRKLIKKY